MAPPSQASPALGYPSLAPSSPNLGTDNIHTPSSPFIPPIDQIRRYSVSPSKRPASPVPAPPSKRHKYGVDPRRVRLSYATTSHLGEYATSELLHTAAILKARQMDIQLHLDPATSFLEEPPSSQSEVYQHVNSSQWELDVVRDGGNWAMVANALRCLLDAFYHKCGYLPKWNDWVRQGETQVHNPRFVTRGACVEDKKEDLREYGIDGEALIYLNGKKSGYRENQSAIHEMCVCAVAGAMAMKSRSVSQPRARAYLLAWKMLTDHDTYEAGQRDRRLIGTEGVVEEEESDGENEGFDEKDWFTQI